ncbi:MAG TPA: SDR family oxidoreductase [Acidimicrobiales bacterium]
MSTLDDCLFVGLDTPATRELAAALQLDLVSPPALHDPDGWRWSFADDVDAFVATIDALPVHANVVACTWALSYERSALVDTDTVHWVRDVERQLAFWYAALTAAAERCADGGAIAVVVEAPFSVDSAGYVAASAVADGLIALTRSVALVHGERRVRANTVTTAIATAPDTLAGMAPPLATFPGTIPVEIAGAVRVALSADAAGISGTVLHADCGRTA